MKTHCHLYTNENTPSSLHKRKQRYLYTNETHCHLYTGKHHRLTQTKTPLPLHKRKHTVIFSQIKTLSSLHKRKHTVVFTPMKHSVIFTHENTIILHKQKHTIIFTQPKTHLHLCTKLHICIMQSSFKLWGPTDMVSLRKLSLKKKGQTNTWRSAQKGFSTKKREKRPERSCSQSIPTSFCA